MPVLRFSHVTLDPARRNDPRKDRRARTIGARGVANCWNQPAWHRDGINAPGGSRLLSERQIVRALWMYRYDRQRRVPIKALAEACQLHRSVLYDAMLTGRVSERARAILSTVIGWIADDRLRFRRAGQVWEPDYRTPPDPLPWPQPRLVRAEDWNEWARCGSCGGWRYTRVTLHGAAAEYYLCDGCLWWETAGMGARPVEAQRRQRASSPHKLARPQRPT
jgi:hypothetical protein